MAENGVGENSKDFFLFTWSKNLSGNELARRSLRNLYKHYCSWCSENKCKSETRKNWKKQVLQYFHMSDQILTTKADCSYTNMESGKTSTAEFFIIPDSEYAPQPRKQAKNSGEDSDDHATVADVKDGESEEKNKAWGSTAGEAERAAPVAVAAPEQVSDGGVQDDEGAEDYLNGDACSEYGDDGGCGDDAQDREYAGEYVCEEDQETPQDEYEDGKDYTAGDSRCEEDVRLKDATALKLYRTGRQTPERKAEGTAPHPYVPEHAGAKVQGGGAPQRAAPPEPSVKGNDDFKSRMSFFRKMWSSQDQDP